MNRHDSNYETTKKMNLKKLNLLKSIKKNEVLNVPKKIQKLLWNHVNLGMQKISLYLYVC